MHAGETGLQNTCSLEAAELMVLQGAGTLSLPSVPHIAKSFSVASDWLKDAWTR